MLMCSQVALLVSVLMQVLASPEALASELAMLVLRSA
jgi:hypothetical protein